MGHRIGANTFEAAHAKKEAPLPSVSPEKTLRLFRTINRQGAEGRMVIISGK